LIEYYVSFFHLRSETDNPESGMNTCCKLDDTSRSLSWKFPVHIGFEATTNYLYQLSSINLSMTVTFDLSETEVVHSSFIGFMIDFKERIVRSGGTLDVIFSPQLKKHFTRMNLYHHFVSEDILKAI